MQSLQELEEELVVINTAIKKIQEGLQSWTSQDGMATEKPRLRVLLAEKKNIVTQIAILKGGYQAQPCFFPGR